MSINGLTGLDNSSIGLYCSYLHANCPSDFPVFCGVDALSLILCSVLIVFIMLIVGVFTQLWSNWCSVYLRILHGQLTFTRVKRFAEFALIGYFSDNHDVP